MPPSHLGKSLTPDQIDILNVGLIKERNTKGTGPLYPLRAPSLRQLITSITRLIVSFRPRCMNKTLQPSPVGVGGDIDPTSSSGRARIAP